MANSTSAIPSRNTWSKKGATHSSTDEFIDCLYRMCCSSNKSLATLGNAFVERCNHFGLSIITAGSLVITTLREFACLEFSMERIAIIIFLYRIIDIDNPIDRSKLSRKQLVEEMFYHPYLIIFMHLIDFGNADNSSLSGYNWQFCVSPVTPQEKILISVLLAGHYNDFCLKSPLEVNACIREYGDRRSAPLFDLSKHREYLKMCHNSYPSIAKTMVPGIFSLANYMKKESSTEVIPLVSELCKASPYSTSLFPSFFQLGPALMPPTDDEFRFLYPSIIEPIWIEECQEQSAFADQSKIAESSPNSEVMNSLPGLPKSLIVDSSIQKRKESVGLSSECVPSCSDGMVNPYAQSSEVIAKIKPLIKREYAIELLKKSYTSPLSRGDTQKLIDALTADSSIGDAAEISLDKFHKFIDENPTVAATIIVNRIAKNPTELQAFFEILIEMNVSVQAMEVVNKLCTQIGFPQEYLNRYVSTCVRKCEDSDDSSQSRFPQVRQVRMVCVFLSSLLRNRTWDVQPLSVELQSFGLKFCHVKEAASLYQEIIGVPHLNES